MTDIFHKIMNSAVLFKGILAKHYVRHFKTAYNSRKTLNWNSIQMQRLPDMSRQDIN